MRQLNIFNLYVNRKKKINDLLIVKDKSKLEVEKGLYVLLLIVWYNCLFWYFFNYYKYIVYCYIKYIET